MVFAWRDEIRDLIDPGYRKRTAAANARRSRRANARARYRPQPQRRRQISDDENPNHFVFGRGWLPKEGCKICIECRLRNDPVGFALTLAYNRATHYSDEVLATRSGCPHQPPLVAGTFCQRGSPHRPPHEKIHRRPPQQATATDQLAQDGQRTGEPPLGF